MPNIKIDDIDIYYELHGKGDPLILIAGYACDHTYWTLMLDELERKYQVLIFDNRAVGQTKDEGDFFTLEQMANDVMALAEHLHLMRPHILGHSMGGAIAQVIAKNDPDKIGKIILLNSTATLNCRTTQSMESILKLRIENIPLDLLIETSMPWLFSSHFLSIPENISSFKSAVKNNPYLQSVKDQERQLKALIKFDSNTWLHKINTNTLIVAAHDDIISLSIESEQLSEKLSHSKLQLISGGHASPIEKSNELCSLICDFLN